MHECALGYWLRTEGKEGLEALDIHKVRFDPASGVREAHARRKARACPRVTRPLTTCRGASPAHTRESARHPIAATPPGRPSRPTLVPRHGVCSGDSQPVTGSPERLARSSFPRSGHVPPAPVCGASWNRTSDLTLIRGRVIASHNFASDSDGQSLGDDPGAVAPPRMAHLQ